MTFDQNSRIPNKGPPLTNVPKTDILKFWHGRVVKDFKLNLSVQTKEIWLRNEKMPQLKVYILFYSLYRATFKIINFWIIKLSSHASLKVRNSRVNRRPIWIMCKVELACLSCWEPSKRSHCHWLELQIGGWESGVLLALYLSNFSCKKIGFAIFGLLGALKARIPSLIGSSNFGRGEVVWEWSAPQVLWLASPHHNLQKNWWWWIGPWDVLDNGSLAHLIS